MKLNIKCVNSGHQAISSTLQLGMGQKVQRSGVMTCKKSTTFVAKVKVLTISWIYSLLEMYLPISS